MRVICISDTHNCNETIRVPDGDLLVHCGDATINGTAEEITRFNEWFVSLPHERKIFVAGNHDRLFETDNAKARQLLDDSVNYLQDSVLIVDGLKIYGSPWQPRFFDWAFNLKRGPEMARKWRLIPEDTDILITHGPPNGILDAVPQSFGWDAAGCEELRKRVDTISTGGRLKAHLFGHIHCGYGRKNVNEVTFVNASTCNEHYEPSNPPIILEV